MLQDNREAPSPRERRRNPTASEAGRIYVGTSGWSYGGWQGRFYPEDLPKKRQLEYISQRFNSVEINGSFYGLLRPDTYRGYYDRTRPGFVFAVKGSRFITHNKKLKDVETALANFFASGVLLLNDKLGPFVWQLGRRFKFDQERVASFFQLLPRDTEAAAQLARRHDHRLSGRSWTNTDRKRPVRHVLEARNESFFVPELVRLARRHQVAIAVSDAADWRCVEEITAGFVYLRLHGHERTYASSYQTELDWWADRIRAWAAGKQPQDARRITYRSPPRRRGRDVYVYFDNDQQAYAPVDGAALQEHLNIAP